MPVEEPTHTRAGILPFRRKQLSGTLWLLLPIALFTVLLAGIGSAPSLSEVAAAIFEQHKLTSLLWVISDTLMLFDGLGAEIYKVSQRTGTDLESIPPALDCMG